MLFNSVDYFKRFDMCKAIVSKIRILFYRICYSCLIIRKNIYFLNNIQTHLTKEEKYKLYKLSSLKKGVAVEIGSYLGSSSCFIALARKKKPGGMLFCVDTWQNDAMSEGAKDTFLTFLENTQNFSDIIRPQRGKSAEVAAVWEGPVDFLFIDGDHSYEGVRADVEAWFPKLSSGALVVFHDYGWAEGVRRVIGEYVAPRAKKEGTLPNLYWAWM